MTADIPCDKLIRIRSNRVLYGPPPDYCGRGRPRKHGEKFKLRDESTWWHPHEETDMVDDKLGHLRIRRWGELHFYKSADHPMELILVERVDEIGQRTHRPLWLIWTGQKMPALDTLWSLYLRRFCVDH